MFVLYLRAGRVVTYVQTKTGGGGGAVSLSGSSARLATLNGNGGDGAGMKSRDPDLPDLNSRLYVLVNENTASAAEVFAAALKVQQPTVYSV